MHLNMCTNVALSDHLGGRHPILELSVSPFILNDAKFDDDVRITYLSGANASGKSVYMKQIGLIVFMAQIGSFVPATTATIGTCALCNPQSS